jgi:transcriptional regulator with XRE-family HTH domain
MNLLPARDLQVGVGQQLRALREIRQVTQRRLSEMTGLDHDTICNLERGRGTVGLLVCALRALDAAVDGCPDVVELGTWIAQRRRDRGLSQDAATKKTGLSKPMLIKLERGQGRIDSFLTALRAYGVQPRLVPRGLGARMRFSVSHRVPQPSFCMVMQPVWCGTSTMRHSTLSSQTHPTHWAVSVLVSLPKS